MVLAEQWSFLTHSGWHVCAVLSVPFTYELQHLLLSLDRAKVARIKSEINCGTEQVVRAFMSLILP